MTTRNQPLRCLALAVLLAIGAGIVWAMAFRCSFSVIDSLVSLGSPQENLRFTQGSTPIISSYENGHIRYRTLGGDPIEIVPEKSFELSYLDGPVNPKKTFFHLPWSERVLAISSDTSPESWFVVYDGNLRGHAYLVGYDKDSKAKLGYLGSNGFCRTKPPQEEQFVVDGQMISQKGNYSLLSGIGSPKEQCLLIYLLTKQGVVEIIPKKRTVKLLRKDTDFVSLNAGVELLNSEDKKTGPRGILLRKPDRVLLLDNEGNELRTYRLPAELRDDVIKFIPLENGTALARKGLAGSRAELFWFDATGKIVKHIVVHLRNPSGLSYTEQALAASFLVPSIGMVGSVLVCYPWGPAGADSLGYGAALSKAIQTCWPALLLTCIVGVIFAVACYRRQRKYGLPWTPVWVGFVFLFGVPGFLGYLAHRRWPARLECPSCGKLAPRDRESCFSCHRNFPEPSPKGTEVFA